MLELTVFLCGAITMILELVNTRILAPYFGTSIVVWTNVIGVVLLSLSVGYYLGGKLADKNKEGDLIGILLLITAFFLC